MNNIKWLTSCKTIPRVKKLMSGFCNLETKIDLILNSKHIKNTEKIQMIQGYITGIDNFLKVM